MMRVVVSLLCVLICNGFVFAQQIVVDNSIGLQQLIEDNLVQDSCVEISNISSSINGNAFGFSSYGYFDRGSSNFPFQNGVMLSTGNAASGGNGVITPILSEGATNWGTDPDIETALGVTNTLNATSIEFDLVSTAGLLQFNYLFASEEYFSTYPCDISDGFVFLIREASSAGPYQNIALVPGTGLPVNTNTIHTDIYNNLGLRCAAENAQYFEGQNLGDTNYNGRTTVLTASATITPNTTYHIKLIIADQSLGDFDSAVFIEANSFRTVDLGPDISTCASSAVLDADIQNNTASYQWFLNNVAITGATNPTYTAIQNGNYRVEVTTSLNAGSCVEVDEIDVTLSTEEPIASITDYELCDESTNGSETATFDLSTKNTELFSNIPFTSFDYSYHPSDADARANTNVITAPITNTGNPQTIYVRIDDLDSNCFAYTTFDLVVNTAPTIVTPSPLEICDNDDDPDGITVIYLSDKDDEITGGNTNLSVSYHNTQADANSGNSPIAIPFINFSSPFNISVFVRVVDTQTGCVNTTTLTINITNGPPVDRSTRFLDACDPDGDGFATFNLTDILPDIEGALTNITTTFHEQYNEALSGANPITNTTNYQNIPIEEQTLYVRVEDDLTGCASIVPLEIHTNLLLTATDTSEFALCDNNEDSSDAFDFFLSVVADRIRNDLPNAADIGIEFYLTDSYTNPITDPIYTVTGTDPVTLYIQLENTATGCAEETSINLRINPILVFQPTSPRSYCDTDDDGIVNIDLHTLDDIVTNGDTNFFVTYYLNDPDLTSNEPAVDSFTNTNPIETVYARIQHIDTGCNSVNPFQIEVVTAPSVTQPTDWIVCDDYDGTPDGFAIIDLDTKIDETVSSRTGLNLSVHNSIDDANTNTNPIPIAELTAYNTSTQTFYIRVEDAISPTGCYAIASFEAIVNTIPVFPVTGISNFPVCVDSNTPTADFYFQDKDAEILGGQTGKTVYYFEVEADATNGVLANAIPKDIAYTSGSRTIYVRVENDTDASCSSTSSFEIVVASNPTYTLPSFFECDDTSNDERFTFNLEEKATEIDNSSTDNLNVTFHRTRTEAENNSNPLPASYTNNNNPESLYARIESSYSLCIVVEEVSINIIAAPDVTEAQPLVVCDTNYDQSVAFDLTLADFEILDRIIGSPPIINYFENEADVFDDALEIPNPTAYISSPKTVYIKITSQSTGCYSVIPLELMVDSPPLTNILGTISICDNDTGTYDLSLVDSMVVDDTSGITITYHNNQSDADNGIAIPSLFPYSATSHNLVVRIEDNTTNCYTTQTFTLQINQNPIANTTPGLLGCDDDFDGLLAFDLYQSTATNILGAQDSNLHNLSFYGTYTNAESATNPLNTVHAATDNEIIYARLENNTTGCFDITQFSVRVNPLPIIPLDDIIPLCINDLPLVINADTGDPSDTYLWSTGATTPQIILNDPSQIGNYWVTATRPNLIGSDCSYTHVFSVIESQQADINFTTTVDFADPNSITVNVSGIGDYIYVLDDGEPQTSNVFENVTFGVHIVTIRDLNGCMPTSQEVVVIDVPKFFTPNNDTIFDTWHIVGVTEIPGTIVYIYNRHGKLLKTLTHNSPGWDGTYNGQNMPTDDYWFVAKVIQEGNAFDVKGHFTLKR